MTVYVLLPLTLYVNKIMKYIILAQMQMQDIKPV